MSGTSSLPMEYEENVDESMSHDESEIRKPELVEPNNVSRPKICHGNSVRVERGKEAAGWKEIHYPQGRVDTFEQCVLLEADVIHFADHVSFQDRL